MNLTVRVEPEAFASHNTIYTAFVRQFSPHGSREPEAEVAAARLERDGKQLDASLISNIERSQVQVKSLETEIVQRRDEQKEAKERFARDRALFRQEICVEQTAISAVTDTK